ncbi:type II toxin-antitoxin system Phd/YefM family antitoxin [Mesorhizobium sp. L-8-3]|uniref:type II toxin-antitoxin system Phd/YefM family antitoxin n=1 Tax=Mesorhizobium sp. L-8-3 TaxID=2744522 RepID=UPI00192646D2|nr:type II toxin-antitoxin system Phd/YefM family antitoxin [Mesorhizobium sp. L-8-3]BCH26432.1 antitoxin [Mesorhizobium sp. L-8-3]
MNISIAEAKAKFSELIKRAEAGEEILVTRHGKVVARVVPPEGEVRKPPLLGALKGQIWIADDFDEPLEEFREYMP